LSYVLTDEAAADLRAIIRTTRQRWGAAQVRRYVKKLEIGIAKVAQGQGAFKTLDALHLGLRVTHCEHHYVFCLPREHDPALIVAIFHERMDVMRRLANRLR